MEGSLLQTNLEKIRYYGEKNSTRNWNFRAFLKSVDLSVEDLDDIVHSMNDKVTAEIDCTACANCCRGLAITLTPEDISRIAAHLGLSEDELKAEYLRYDQEERSFEFKSKPCPFLSRKLCSIYDKRPEACRDFPNLHKDEFVFRLISVVHNYSECPIVFNVYEQLKIHFGNDGSRGSEINWEDSQHRG
jgi:Fe-S-cluster containining protein